MKLVLSRVNREQAIRDEMDRKRQAWERTRPELQRKVTPKSERPLCGARTRAGGQCKGRAVWDHENDYPVNGRCKLHGGLSTGPKSAEGRARSLANLKRGQRHHQEGQARRGEGDNQGQRYRPLPGPA
jgi:hypothetical protein